MPSTGFYLFLLLHKKPLRHFIESVNALNGLLLISSQNICNLNRILCVSMPSTGFYLFEQSYLTNFTEVSVSMPSTGFYLFLPLDGWKMLKTINMCQCPQRASTYFFRFPKKMKHGLRNVSMPSTGFYLFLQLWRHIVQLSQEYCVNALNGLLLISSPDYGSVRHKICSVSMPSTGFYLFLR